MQEMYCVKNVILLKNCKRRTKTITKPTTTIMKITIIKTIITTNGMINNTVKRASYMNVI